MRCSGVLFAKAEGILPAPEANHAVKGAIEEALRCKSEGKVCVCVCACVLVGRRERESVCV